MRRLILACATASVSACTEPPPAASTSSALVAPARTPEARIPLTPLALGSQADFDALEERWTSRRSDADLLALLKALAAAQPKPDTLLLQRIGVLVADGIGRDRAALDASLEAGTALRVAAPDDPHTLWFNGWVLWRFLTIGGDIAVDDPSARDLANAAIAQWTSLLAKAPEYVGPRKHSAAEVKASMARIQAALAEQPQAASAPTPARSATLAEVEALSLLDRFASAPDGSRRGICRDWMSRPRAAEPSPAEVRVDLACATLDGVADRALAAIARLRQSEGPAFDPCSALARVEERADKATFAKAIAAQPLGFACP